MDSSLFTNHPPIQKSVVSVIKSITNPFCATSRHLIISEGNKQVNLTAAATPIAQVSQQEISPQLVILTGTQSDAFTAPECNVTRSNYQLCHVAERKIQQHYENHLSSHHQETDNEN
jgi:hypothetical protein